MTPRCAYVGLGPCGGDLGTICAKPERPLGAKDGVLRVCETHLVWRRTKPFPPEGLVFFPSQLLDVRPA